MSQMLSMSQRAFKDAPAGKLGMWIFLIMDGLSFATILIGAAYLRTNGAPWPNPGEVLNIPLTAVNTFILMFSSFTMMNALEAVKVNDQRKFIQFLVATLVLGIAFLSIQVTEYVHFILENFKPSTSVYAACFYGATGYHGIHVLSGIIFITYILVRALKGGFSADNYGRVETLTLYWHFVDLMWMLVFTVVYLL